MRGGLVAATIAACVVSSASRMEVRAVPGPEFSSVVAVGEMTAGDANRVREAVRSQSGKEVGLIISSPGGSIREAAELADMVSRRRLPVFVGRECVSACFLVLAASPERVASRNARIGVHSASRFGAEDTAAMARAAASHGVPQGIIGRMVTTRPDEVAWLTAAELRAMRVSVVDDSPSRVAASSLATTPASPPPSPTALSPATAVAPTPPAESFERGRADRDAWEQWFGQQVAGVKAGADYWAGQRSLPKPGNCESSDAAFTAGCADAR